MGEKTHHGLGRARVRLGQTPIHVEPVTDKGVDMPERLIHGFHFLIELYLKVVLIKGNNRCNLQRLIIFTIILGTMTRLPEEGSKSASDSGLFDDGTVGIEREQNWLESFLNRVFPNSPLFWGRQTTTSILDRETNPTAIVMEQLGTVSDQVNMYLRTGFIDKALLRHFYGDAEALSLALFQDDRLYMDDPQQTVEAWIDHLFPLVRPGARDIEVSTYADDWDDPNMLMKEIPLGLLREEGHLPFLSLGLHDETTKSVLVRHSDHQVLEDFILATAYAADAQDLQGTTTAQFLIADICHPKFRDMYKKMLRFKTYGHSEIEGATPKNEHLLRALVALNTLTMDRRSGESVETPYQYIFYIPDMQWFIEKNDKTWDSLVRPLLDNPDLRISIIMGMPYGAVQEREVLPDMLLLGNMDRPYRLEGLGRHVSALTEIPPHTLAFLESGELHTILIPKP